MNVSFEQNKILITEFDTAFKQHSAGELEKAELNYKKILKKYPSHFDTLRHLGILYQDKKMYILAERFFSKAFNINSNEASIYNNLGTIKFLQYKMDDAIKFYIKAFKINPRYIPVVNNITMY